MWESKRACTGQDETSQINLRKSGPRLCVSIVQNYFASETIYRAHLLYFSWFIRTPIKIHKHYYTHTIIETLSNNSPLCLLSTSLYTFSDCHHVHRVSSCLSSRRYELWEYKLRNPYEWVRPYMFFIPFESIGTLLLLPKPSSSPLHLNKAFRFLAVFTMLTNVEKPLRCPSVYSVAVIGLMCALTLSRTQHGSLASWFFC